jgi:ABC-type uncharacterized transport system ATPase subunit
MKAEIIVQIIINSLLIVELALLRKQLRGIDKVNDKLIENSVNQMKTNEKFVEFTQNQLKINENIIDKIRFNS